jgi:hypothetical protein
MCLRCLHAGAVPAAAAEAPLSNKRPVQPCAWGTTVGLKHASGRSGSSITLASQTTATGAGCLLPKLLYLLKLIPIQSCFLLQGIPCTCMMRRATCAAPPFVI